MSRYSAFHAFVFGRSRIQILASGWTILVKVTVDVPSPCTLPYNWPQNLYSAHNSVCNYPGLSYFTLHNYEVGAVIKYIKTSDSLGYITTRCQL